LISPGSEMPPGVASEGASAVMAAGFAMRDMDFRELKSMRCCMVLLSWTALLSAGARLWRSVGNEAFEFRMRVATRRSALICKSLCVERCWLV
jgi:hypothetical protein